MSVDKINRAIRECLQRCYGSDDTIATVAGFVGELQDSIGWTVEEIHAVELPVLRMLGIIAAGVSCPGDVPNWTPNDQQPDRKMATMAHDAPRE